MSNTRRHHPFSPSKLQYLEASPHWIPEPDTATEASERGTAQHDAAEHGVHIDDPRLADHEAIAVALCKSYREELIAQAGPDATVLQEEYLPIDDKDTTAGYIDCAIISADSKTADIIDYKFGLWSVEPAVNNLQGIAYLLGVYHKYPTLEKITVHFLLPHRNEIDTHTFTKGQFDSLLLRVKTVVARAKSAREKGDTEHCNATVGTCLFCGNKARCKALANFILTVARKYAPLRVPENVTPSLMLDPEQATAQIEIADLLQAWAKAVRAQITAKTIEDEQFLPGGYELRSRADNTVKDWKAIVRTARKAGVPKQVISEAMSLKMTPINKGIEDAFPRGEKKAARESFTQSLLDTGALEKEPAVYFLQRLKT